MVRPPGEGAVQALHAHGRGRRPAAGGVRDGVPGGSLTRPIALVGLRCTGKSTVGRGLAARLGRELVDTDEVVAALDGRGLRAGEVLASLGEPAFRELEHRALEEALRPDTVVATGGGCVEHEPSRALLAERALCIRLVAPLEVLAARLRADPTPRPPLESDDAAAELAELAARRAPRYAELADMSVDTGADDPTRIAERIASELRTKGLA